MEVIPLPGLFCVPAPWSRDCFSQHRHQRAHSTKHYIIFHLVSPPQPCSSHGGKWGCTSLFHLLCFRVWHIITSQLWFSTKVSINRNIPAIQYLRSTRPTLVCSCSWVQARPCRLDWRHHLPAESSLSFITQEGRESQILPAPWTPATDLAYQTLSNSSADGKAATHLCCDLISLIHLATSAR